MKVGIVTDSGADIPLDLAKDLGIEVIPFQVTIDGREYRDGIDLTQDEFYKRMTDGARSRSFAPQTSQPAPGIFVDTYRRLLEKFDSILSIHVSGKLSGALNTAQLAKEMISGADIRIVDSLSVSMGMGGMVLEAYRALQKGFNLNQVVNMLELLRERVRVFVSLDTLEFLKRGGRIGKVKALLGSVLQIKPLIWLVNGEVEPISRVRNKRDMIPMLFEEAKRHIAAESRSIIAIMHTAAEEEANKLKTLVQGHFKQAEILLQQAGPALGTHAGPGALAVSFVPAVLLAK